MPESKFADEDVVESKFDDDSREEKTAGGSGKGGSCESKIGNGEEVTLMMRATNYCFSSEFIQVFEKFINDNAHVFYPSADGEEEHRLEYTECFQGK